MGTDNQLKKVLCVGELLLRMSPQANGRWIEGHHMATYIGGAELNVATALARWGVSVKYFTALPDNALTQDILSHLNLKNIDTSAVQIAGNRIGLYYLPQGKDLKNAGAIYDRAHSSYASIQPGQVDWDTLLEDVFWLHLSAISPALNELQPLVCLELLQAAVRKQLFVSIDLNYRSKLWQYGPKPPAVMSQLLPYCDMVMGNIWAAHQLLGIPLATDKLDDSKEAYLAHALSTSQSICQMFPRVKVVANTFRFDVGEQHVRYYATLYANNQIQVSEEINAQHILDRIGSGDCFMAGLIYGTYHRFDPLKLVNFSAKAAVGKMYEASDATDQSEQEVLSNRHFFNQPL